MRPQFLEVRDLDNAMTTVNINQINLLIIPGPLSQNRTHLCVFVNGTSIKLPVAEAHRLQKFLVDEGLVH